ncbi:MAG: hypothetical protein LDL07_06155 [Desulfarculus sp.]|nr:hypothetical protein [Desulfarculus sp.]
MKKFMALLLPLVVLAAMVVLAGLVALVGLAGVAWAGHKQPERVYQVEWCQQERGRLEVVMADGTRCDCLTRTHAVEVDFGRKWAEALGQALNYAMQTGKQPGILLVIERAKDFEAVDRLQRIAERWGLPLRIWTVVDLEE